MKKLIYGFVVIVAIGLSAFTNVKATGDIYTNHPTEPNPYILTTDYDPTKCLQEANPCAFRVTASGASHVSGSSLTQAQINTYLANGWIEQVGTDRGSYLD